MKMTPRDKALLATGEARGILKERIKKARRDARYVFGEPYCCITSKEKEHIWYLNHLESLIKDYQKKRAACRAFSPYGGTNCENCLHKGKSIGDHPCFSCTPPNGSNNNWEPRKEGE